VCSNDSHLIEDLPKHTLIQKLEKYVKTNVPNELIETNYGLYKCQNCSLEFANPLVAGSDSFYKYLSSILDTYYTEDRWEYLQLTDIISSDKVKEFSILDLGCGDGRFLNQINKKFPNSIQRGIDTNFESIQKCIRRGIKDVYPCEITEFIQKYNKNNKYKFIVALHLLEHLPKPVEFLEQSVSLLEESGRLFLSTPYSPMSIEANWFHPLNHPPHHLSRWNMKAYKELSNQLDLKINFYMPKATSWMKRSLNSFIFEKGIKDQKTSVKLAYAFGNILTLIKSFRAQSKREKYHGRTVPDVILAELYR
jgi:2-polyprenyl-3-methyl-5-hydroxy-6-metoxy-1,4-benzoquinol methylase